MKKYIVEVCDDEVIWRHEDGQLHRVERVTGYRAWYVDGKYHREGGPAVIHPNQYRAWYINGFLHREDGPAMEYEDGRCQWWINGNYFESEEKYNNRNNKELTVSEIESLLGYSIKIIKG